MPPIDLNARIAREVMGWEICPVEEPLKSHICFVGDDKIKHLREIPDFTHSLDACALAEAEIERRKLTRKYREALTWPIDESFSYDWWLIRLTPAQRVTAMLKAVKAEAEYKVRLLEEKPK